MHTITHSSNKLYFLFICLNQKQMFRTIAILASIVGASAFAPVARVVTRASALQMSYEVLLLLMRPSISIFVVVNLHFLLSFHVASELMIVCSIFFVLHCFLWTDKLIDHHIPYHDLPRVRPVSHNQLAFSILGNYQKTSMPKPSLS